MPLNLILHDLPPEGIEAMEAAVWELSESHWTLAGGMLVATGVSPSYLLTHLRRALLRAGIEGAILVTRCDGALHMAGVDDAARAWVADHQENSTA